jgi:hypothetical protein
LYRISGRSVRLSHVVIGCILVSLLLVPSLLVGQSKAAFAEPQIVITPDRGAPGTNVKVSGSGFAPLALISISFDGDTMKTRPEIITASALGNFDATFYVPHSVKVGTYPVVAKSHGLITSSASATFSVTGPNSPPTADSQSVTTDMGRSIEIVLTGDDRDGDEITFSIIDHPKHGNITGFDSSSGSLTYVPAEEYFGKDRFTFKANDGKADSHLAEVSITINESAPGPRMDNIAVELDEDTEIVIYLNATDADGSSLTFSIVSNPLHGSLGELKSYDADTGYVTYTPNPNFNGTDSFTSKASDSQYDSETATITITVLPVQDIPVAQGAQAETVQGQAVTLNLVAIDPDGDTLEYSLESQPSHGTLTGTAPNLTYIASNEYRGWDNFTFKVNDGISDSNVARVEIFVQEAGTSGDDQGSGGGDGSSSSGSSGGSDSDAQAPTPPVADIPSDTEQPSTPDQPTIPGTSSDNQAPPGDAPPATPAAVVGDTVPPRLILPATTLVFDTQSEAGSTVTFNVAAIDDRDGEVTPECSPNSGYRFPIGKVNVVCNASDSSGNTAIGSFTVEVRLLRAEAAQSQIADLLAPILAVAIVGAAGVATYAGMRARRANLGKSREQTATKT